MRLFTWDKLSKFRNLTRERWVIDFNTTLIRLKYDDQFTDMFSSLWIKKLHCFFCKAGRLMIQGFSSEQTKGQQLNRNCTDKFCSLRPSHRSRLLCHVEEWMPPSDPTTLPVVPRFFLTAVEGPLVTWLGQGGEAGSRVEARPLNGLTQRRAHSKAESLSTGTIRAGTEVAHCPVEAAHVYSSKSFPQISWVCAERKQPEQRTCYSNRNSGAGTFLCCEESTLGESLQRMIYYMPCLCKKNTTPLIFRPSDIRLRHLFYRRWNNPVFQYLCWKHMKVFQLYCLNRLNRCCLTRLTVCWSPLCPDLPLGTTISFYTVSRFFTVWTNYYLQPRWSTASNEFVFYSEPFSAAVISRPPP